MSLFKVISRLPSRGSRPGGSQEETAGLERAALKGAGIFLVRYGIAFILNFVGSVVIARFLGPSIWGLYAISSFVLTLYALISLGVWGYLVQSPREPKPQEIRTCFTLQHVFGGLSAVLTIFVVAPALGRYFQDDALVLFVRGAGVGGYFYCWRWTALALAERKMDYRTVAAAELVDIVAFNLCAVSGVFLGEGVLGLAVGNALRGAASAFYSYLRIPSHQLGLGWERGALKEILRFALPYLAFALLQWLPVHGGPVLVGFLINAQALGYVQLAYRILEYPRVLVTLIFRVGMSAYSKLQDQPAALNHLVQRSLTLLYWLIAPTISLMAALSPWWVPAIYGPAWWPMVDIMFVLAIPFMVTAGYAILATVLSATGAVKPAAFFQAAYNALYWSAAVVLVSRLGHLGLPAAEWVALAAGAILLVDYRRHCGPFPLRGIVVKLALSGAAIALGWRLAH